MSLSVLWEGISALTEGGPVSQDKETGEEMEHAATCCGWNQALAHSISGACASKKLHQNNYWKNRHSKGFRF